MTPGDDEPILDTDRPDLVVRGADGDPLPEAASVRMIEIESIERVEEGLKMSAEAASRLVRMESEHTEYWMGFVRRLDMMRKIFRQHVGKGAEGFNETPKSWGGDPGEWTPARKQFRDGMKQSAGGMRQLATCHRGDLAYSTWASHLEAITEKLNRVTHETVRQAQRQNALWVPENYRGGA